MRWPSHIHAVWELSTLAAAWHHAYDSQRPVTVLASRWRLGHELYRETGDVDLGIPPVAARDHHVVGRLKDLDYTQVAGNRFARGLSDIPVTMKGKDDSPRPEAFIDVLVPAYTSRARESVQATVKAEEMTG